MTDDKERGAVGKRNADIRAIAAELVSIGNDPATIAAMARAATSLRPMTEVQHTQTGQTGILQPEVNDSLQVHVRSKAGQMFCCPRLLKAISTIRGEHRKDTHNG